jgi:heme/copper-type cytochrome/quinol oxidase subunit 1
MKSWVKEIIWFVGTLIVAYLLCDPYLTFNSLESTVDINVHDTYFVVASLHILILIVVVVFFIVYLIRMLIYRFRNLAANSIFIVANALQVLIFIGLTNVAKSVIDMAGTTVYPPLSGPDVIHSNDDRFKPLYYTLIIITVVLSVFELFVVYKTVIHYRKSKQATLN